MLIDLTLLVTPKIAKDAQENLAKASYGHLGTHFDVMNKVFPLEYTERAGIVFDVSHIQDRDIDICDIDMSLIEKDMFIMFSTGFIEMEGYGTPNYFNSHPQLSKELINTLLEKNISMIGVDFSGLRRGKEHTPTDQICADRGIFVVENLCNLQRLLSEKAVQKFKVYTFPMNFDGMTGLPCRVVAKI